MGEASKQKIRVNKKYTKKTSQQLMPVMKS